MKNRLIVSKISGTLGIALDARGGVPVDVARTNIGGRAIERAEEVETVSIEDVLRTDKEKFATPYEDIQRV